MNSLRSLEEEETGVSAKCEFQQGILEEMDFRDTYISVEARESQVHTLVKATR